METDDKFWVNEDQLASYYRDKYPRFTDSCPAVNDHIHFWRCHVSVVQARRRSKKRVYYCMYCRGKLACKLDSREQVNVLMSNPATGERSIQIVAGESVRVFTN